MGIIFIALLVSSIIETAASFIIFHNREDIAMDDLIWEIIIHVLVLFLTLLMTYSLISRLQTIITKPIFHLSGLAATLSEKEDYTLRATKFNDDEIGLLAETMNAMLENMGNTNAALREARIEAERASHMKSDFLAVMSHEIRTPMNGIIGTADLLSETPLSQTQKKYTSTIIKSSQTLLELITDILDFSKIEAGKLEIEHTTFNITQHIQDVIDMLSVSVRQKQLGFNFVNNLNDDYYLRGDPVRIKQILINLTSNAIKFTQEGTITITIDEDTQVASDKEIKQIWISVTDTGIGISPDKQDHIFDSFSQADTSTTRKFGGSGLGLSICKSLATMMNGTVGVQSVPDEGSTFWFSIPLEISSKDDFIATVSPPPLQPRIGDDNRILLVEDNHTNITITEEILKKAGYEVTVCENGKDAFSAYIKDVFPLILMDCHMPIMDGFEATQRIRNFEQDNSLPRSTICALSASVMQEDKDKCIAVGMDTFIAKPFRRDELLAKLQAFG